MKCVEINPKGNFDTWESCKLNELAKMETSKVKAKHTSFENEMVKLRIITLEPYERVPFQKISENHNITCLTDGLAISRFSDGKVSLLRFKKGDASYHEIEDTAIISDFQNIGEAPLKIAILEHKSI